MPTNPLKSASEKTARKSVFRAKEWAQMARDKGLKATAEAWDQAHEDGWDEEHYCTLAAENYRKRIVDARATGR